MSRIPSKNTKPEETVRKYLFGQGFRYKRMFLIFRGNLILFCPNIKLWCLSTGAFGMHIKDANGLFRLKSNTEFWEKKFAYNIEQDNRNYKNSKILGGELLLFGNVKYGIVIANVL